MAKVIRYQIADYMNTASGGGEAVYALMGAGFTSLDENPAAKIDTTAYISDRSASGTVTGYETTFPFNTLLKLGLQICTPRLSRATGCCHQHFRLSFQRNKGFQGHRKDSYSVLIPHPKQPAK